MPNQGLFTLEQDYGTDIAVQTAIFYLLNEIIIAKSLKTAKIQGIYMVFRYSKGN